jgi:amino acid adenylation domain-containing protein
MGVTSVNATYENYTLGRCIHELFEDQAARWPDAAALVFGNERLSYAELNRRSNQLAHFLVNEVKVKPDTLVGLCLERSLELVIGMLGVLKAGGAYVPLDPEYPEARIRYMLKDASLKTVLTGRIIGKRVSGIERAVYIDQDNFQERFGSQSTANIATHALGLQPNHLVYVIYTSGSTGWPKGVMVEHRSLTNLIKFDTGFFNITANSKLLNPLSFGFDAGNGYAWEALCAGACLFLVSPTDDLFKMIKEKHISHAVMTAAIMRNQDPCPSSTLEVLISGGDAYDKRVLDHLAPQTRFYNVYGPTETTVTATCQHIVGDKHCGIGKPITNVECHVLNEQLQPLPAGERGELYIGGAGLARGYLNQPDLTKERFIPNPYYNAADSCSSKRLYRTGDLARWLTDRNLEFLGRVDYQVKIRGFRVECGEIEHALRELPSVQEAVVMAQPRSGEGAEGDKQLVAYIAPRQSDGEGLEDIGEKSREALKARLPQYMVPAYFVVLEKMPLTPGGKVDRNGLLELNFDKNQMQYQAPRTETERVLCEIWQSILGMERVGVNDDFFRLGGHSLSALKAINKIKSTMGVKCELYLLFENGVLSDFARVIEEKIAKEVVQHGE